MAAAVSCGLFVNAGASAGHHGAHPPRPNVVVVMTDDQALSQLNAQTMPETTRLLRHRGTVFTDAIVTTPLCCPSRASLETGQYGHNNGVLTNDYHALRQNGNVLPAWLQRAGYVTAHVGKFLNLYRRSSGLAQPGPGWTQWHTILSTDEQKYYDYEYSNNGNRVHYGTAPRDYITRVMTRQAVRLIHRYRKRPLYLEFDTNAPHRGGGGTGTRCAGAAVPDPRDTKLFTDEPLPDPPSFNEADVSDKPPFIQSLPQFDSDQIDTIRRFYQCADASLVEVDRAVAKLYAEFQRLGELNRTVFIFDTDNANFYGEHRIFDGKLYPYEESIHVPLLIKVPSRYRNGVPRVPRVSDPVANIDLAPTILALAHGKPCKRHGLCRVMDGRSLLPLIRGRVPSWAPERPLAVELDVPRARKGVCTYQGVRTPAATYILHTRIGDPSTGLCTKQIEQERYDLQGDPYELDNLCYGGGSCPSDETQGTLEALLTRLRDCAGIAGRDPRPESGHYCG